MRVAIAAASLQAPQTMEKTLFAQREAIEAQALFLGEAIDLQTIQNSSECLASLPLAISIEDSECAILFPYGVAVLFGLSEAEQTSFLQKLSPLVTERFEAPETEEVEIRLSPQQSERAKDGIVWLQAFSVPRLQLLADVLAKTVVLAHYETSVADVFDRIEPFALSLQQKQRHGEKGKELLRQVGSSFWVQYKTVGRVEIVDKPELLWEAPELEYFYSRLEDEYEIRERHLALERKLELISKTAVTVLEFMQHSSSQRVEWYIVILIFIEIVLSLYGMFVQGGGH